MTVQVERDALPFDRNHSAQRLIRQHGDGVAVLSGRDRSGERQIIRRADLCGRRELSPLGVDRRVRRDHLVEVKGRRTLIGGVPAVEAVEAVVLVHRCVRCGRGRRGRLLAGFDGLIRRGILGAVALHIEGHGDGGVLLDVVAVSRRSVVQGDALRILAEGIALRIGLAAGIVRLVDGVRTGVRHALKVAAGDERRVLLGALDVVAVEVGVGCGFSHRKDAAGDAGDFSIVLVGNGVVVRRGAVRVDLRALADLADDRQVGGVRVTVQDTVAVGVDIDVLDRADLRAGQIGIVVDRRTRRAAGGQGLRRRVRRGRGAGVERGVVVVDRSAPGGRAGDRRQGSLAAVDRGDDALVGNDRGSRRERVALADQVDGRRVVVVDDNVGLAAGAGVGGAGGAAVGIDVNHVVDAVARVLAHAVARIGKRIGGSRSRTRLNSAVFDRADVTGVIRRVGARIRLDRAVVDRTDRRGVTLVIRRKFVRGLGRCKQARAGVVLHGRALGERAGIAVLQRICRRCSDGAVFQRADRAVIAQRIVTGRGER